MLEKNIIHVTDLVYEIQENILDEAYMLPI